MKMPKILKYYREHGRLVIETTKESYEYWKDKNDVDIRVWAQLVEDNNKEDVK